jgi:hypothetical protein
MSILSLGRRGKRSRMDLLFDFCNTMCLERYYTYIAPEQNDQRFRNLPFAMLLLMEQNKIQLVASTSPT